MSLTLAVLAANVVLGAVVCLAFIGGMHIGQKLAIRRMQAHVDRELAKMD